MKKNQAYSELVCDYGVENTVAGEDSYCEKTVGNIKVEYLKIKSKEYETLLMKRAGNYVSIHFDEVCGLTLEEERELIDILALEIRTFLKESNKRVLIAGIGNPDFIVDSVGKRAVQKLNLCGEGKLFAVSVDISEHTGIESVDFIRGIAGVTHSDAVVVIDSVLTKSCERLSRTVQLTDAGVLPGAALGAVKKAIDRDALGIPTVVIGVPVVIDSHSMLLDAFDELEIEKNEQIDAFLKEKKKLFLASHSVDFVIERFSYIIARAIESAVS